MNGIISYLKTYWRCGLSRIHSLTNLMFKPNISTFSGKESNFLLAFSLHFKILDTLLLTYYSEVVVYGKPILLTLWTFLELYFFLNSSRTRSEETIDH